MTNGILPRPPLALFGHRPRAEPRVAAVGLDLPEGRHCASGRNIGFVSPDWLLAAAPALLPNWRPLSFPLIAAGPSPALLAAPGTPPCVLSQSVAAICR